LKSSSHKLLRRLLCRLWLVVCLFGWLYYFWSFSFWRIRIQNLLNRFRLLNFLYFSRWRVEGLRWLLDCLSSNSFFFLSLLNHLFERVHKFFWSLSDWFRRRRLLVLKSSSHKLLRRLLCRLRFLLKRITLWCLGLRRIWIHNLLNRFRFLDFLNLSRWRV